MKDQLVSVLLPYSQHFSPPGARRRVPDTRLVPLTVHVKAPFRPERDERPPGRAAGGLRCRHIDSFNLLMPLRAQRLPAWLGHARRHLAALVCGRRCSLLAAQIYVLAKHRKFDRTVTGRSVALLRAAGARRNRAASWGCAVARYPACGPHLARPGTRAHRAAGPRAVCALCRTVLVTSFEYDDDPGLYSGVGLEMRTAVCGSRCAAAAERSEVVRCRHVDIRCVYAAKSTHAAPSPVCGSPLFLCVWSVFCPSTTWWMRDSCPNHTI